MKEYTIDNILINAYKEINNEVKLPSVDDHAVSGMMEKEGCGICRT
ncbi:hypothetical protein Bmyc01_25210 [Bacillus mycoides]|nr:hypothetical protein Bmyc01_25210 [Bacillus mycoides]